MSRTGEDALELRLFPYRESPFAMAAKRFAPRPIRRVVAGMLAEEALPAEMKKATVL